jgi:hypothetical protein
MKKLIFTVFAALVLQSASSFADTNPCYGKAVQTIQGALKSTSYAMGDVVDESTSDSAMFSAEVLQNGTFIGTYVVVMNPTTCATQSARFDYATP